ncbi:MAG: DUF2341 domain-containing protein [Candidatus Kariarchaeaceae archaeon]
MNFKKSTFNYILLIILTVNFSITGLVIGGNILNDDNFRSDTLDSKSLLEKDNNLLPFQNENTDLSTKKPTIYEETDDTLPNNFENSFSSSHPNIRNDPNFLIINEGQPWGLSSFKYRKAIKIDKFLVSGSGSLTNFPLLLNLLDEDLHNDVQSNGNDIAFTDYNGNKIDHEIELFDQTFSSTQAKLVVWVRIPILSSTSDTTFFMYFSASGSPVQENPIGVWDSNYVGVWHLNETNGGSLAIRDSTSNENNGTDSGNPTFGSSGVINSAIDFDGTDDYFSIIDNTNIDITDKITLEAWAKNTQSSSSQSIYYFNDYDPSEVWDESPAAMVDGDTGTDARSNWNVVNINETQLLTGNSAPATNAGTIKKVEIRARIDVYGVGRIYITPIFSGGNGTIRVFQSIFTSWTSWFDITNDPNAPPNWSGTDLQNLDARVMVNDPASHNGRIYQVEIRVTYVRSAISKGEDSYALNFNEDGSTVYGFINNSDTSTENINVNDWNHYALTYNGTHQILYINGSQTNSSAFTSGIPTNSKDLFIGTDFAGLIDEVRISNTSRSSDWVTTEFNNQNDPTSFLTTGMKHTQKYWIMEQFSFRKNITIDNSVVSGSNNLVNFPFLLELYDSDLKYKTLPSGNDILFTDFEGVLYAHEMEEFNQNFNSSHAYLRAWIKIPYLSATENTRFVMYYGNPNAVDSYENPSDLWDSYNAVYHFNDCCVTPSNVVDSTSNGINLTRIPISGMNSNDWVPSQIGNGLDFDGTDDGLDSSLSTTISDFTFSAWFKIDSIPFWSGIISVGPNRHMGISDTGYLYYWDGTDILFSNSAPVSTSIWYYGVITYSSSTLNVYLNGQQKTPATKTLGSYSGQIAIGYHPTGVDFLDGIIDESRVTSIARSDDWITTEFNNQNDPKNYLTLSSEEQFINIFDYRKPITIESDQISGSSEIRDLPIYFDFNDSDIRTKAQANGTDIYFADNNGTKLLHEFFKYSDNGSHIHMKVWVRVNRIQPTIDTRIYMYYGNSDINSLEAKIGIGQGVFDAIYQLDENTIDEQNSAIHNDSASGFNANQDGNEAVIGIIDGAQKFDGVDDQIVVNSTLGLQPSGDVTISGWFKLDSTFDGTSTSNVILTRQLTSSDNIHFALVGTDYSRSSNALLNNMPNGSLVVKIEVGGPDTWHWTNRTTWTAGTWYHFAYIIDSDAASNNRIYINGIDDTDVANAVVEDENEDMNYSADWEIGGGTVDTSQFSGGTRYFTGSIDEIRIIKGVMTSGWIQTEYNSINDPQNMYSIRDEEQNFPYLQDFGVYDPGNGFPQYWTNITGGWQGSINSATIDIDSTPFSMSYNGTHWVYVPADTVFNTTYSYQIMNATNTLGQYLQTTSTLESYTSDKDIIDPTIDGTPQYDGSTINDGIFRVNVSDSWGNIDTVLLTILDHSDPNICGGSCYSSSNVVMQNNSIEFVNDSINLFKGTLTYQIVINDTVGNTFVSGNQTANVLNKIPSVSNITLTPISLKSSDTLVLSYDYFDPENAINASIDSDGGTEIRWYLNGTHQSAYDDSLTIPPAALSLYDIWNVSVRPKDGIQFGVLKWYSGPQVIVSNSAPEASDLVITPALPTNTSDLTADWTFFDEDGDTQPADSWIIRWYNNISGLQSTYNDSKIVPASATVKDQEWWFTLYVSDGFQYSIEYTSPNKTIVNSAPTASNVAIEGSPRTTDLLNATWDYNDADFDSEISFTLHWYMDNGSGFIYQSQFDNNMSINPSFTERDQVWNFTLEVFDGTNYSILYTSPTKTIINSAPTASGLTITSNPDTTLDLVANWTYTDADNDTQSSTWRVRWYRDGILVSSFNDLLTVPAGYTNKSEVWNYTVQVFDSTEYSILYYSTSTTIQNTAPVVTSVLLTPYNPNATSSQNLQVFWTYYDIDADSENISAVQVLMNGILNF